jgi:hypothetical protein
LRVGGDVAAPASSSAATIAASSVRQRSSWKFDQLTPTVTAAVDSRGDLISLDLP